MKKSFLPIVFFLITVSCGSDFEPDLKGWRAYTHPARRVHLELDGRHKTIQLPGEDGIGYRYPQWTKQNQLLLIQSIKTDSCFDYQIIAVDTTGAIVDTVYTPAPNTPVNYSLAPNDSLLIVKTYEDNCTNPSSYFRYTIYNRHLKKGLTDTIAVGNARGIPMLETPWSPDSKKVIIPQWAGGLESAFVYDLVTKDTTYIDKGRNFIWSPSDNDLVGYIKDNSIYTMNTKTGAKDLVFEGKKKRSAANFRWNPNGDFLMILIRSYLLNVEARPLTRTTIIYFSLKDRIESRVFYDGQRIHTWKDVHGPLTK